MFRARVELGAGKVVGYLTIIEADGTDSTRVVEADDCTEVVDALALIAALAIDPHATTELPAAPPPPEPGPPGRTATVAARLRLHGELVVHGALVGGVFSKPLAGASVGAGVESSGRRWLRPSARVGLTLTGPRSSSMAEGTAEVRQLAVDVEVCPIEMPLATWLGLRPCGIGSGGTVRARGSDVDAPQTASARWLALGGLVGLVARLTPWFLVEARGLALMPTARDRFLISDTVVHQYPPVTWRAEMGVGVSFPPTPQEQK